MVDQPILRPDPIGSFSLISVVVTTAPTRTYNTEKGYYIFLK